MQAPESILSTWNKFSGFPMETLTKAWYFNHSGETKQRSVSLMREHREQYGITGNCFDLALWLFDEFRLDGNDAFLIGDIADPDDMHAAVVAVDETGTRYLCDLGDQWLQPIRLETVTERLSGFFPAAEITMDVSETEATVRYRRPNGKTSLQPYPLQPIAMADFLKAAEYSQRHIHPEPLVECRVPHGSETAHWEFYNWSSALSTNNGLVPEPDADSLEAWTLRICGRTGYDPLIVTEALRYFDGVRRK